MQSQRPVRQPRQSLRSPSPVREDVQLSKDRRKKERKALEMTLFAAADDKKPPRPKSDRKKHKHKSRNSERTSRYEDYELAPQLIGKSLEQIRREDSQKSGRFFDNAAAVERTPSRGHEHGTPRHNEKKRHRLSKV
jgi:hypothetical protein